MGAFTVSDDQAAEAEIERLRQESAEHLAWVRNRDEQLVALRQTISEADLKVSAVHDHIYAEPFDREAANRAIWQLHDLLRAALAEQEAPDG